MVQESQFSKQRPGKLITMQAVPKKMKENGAQTYIVLLNMHDQLAI